MTTAPVRMTEKEEKPFASDLVVTSFAVADTAVEVAEVAVAVAAMLEVVAAVVLRVEAVVAAVALTLICALVEVVAWAVVVQVHPQVHPVLLVQVALPNEPHS